MPCSYPDVRYWPAALCCGSEGSQQGGSTYSRTGEILRRGVDASETDMAGKRASREGGSGELHSNNRGVAGFLVRGFRWAASINLIHEG